MRTWLFQANPDTFDIDGYLAGRDHITWTVRQEHLAPEMNPGDAVYLWRSIGNGGNREVSGVVASGVLVESPAVVEDDAEARPFWRDDGYKAALRVRIRLTKVANKREVLKRDWLAEDPVLADLGVLKLRNLTNYAVTEVHAERLGGLWANTGRDWDRNDSLAGLWAYDQTYGGPVSKSRGSAVANIALLIGRAVPGVYNKVMNFRSLDPRDQRQGFTGAGNMDEQVWQEFFDSANGTIRSDALDDEFRRTWQSKPSNTPKSQPTYAEFGEAPNDDPAELRTFLRVLRRGQPAFRRNLLAAYECRCCISGWAPETILEAAHIEEHSKTGLNSLGNGLLLRSDLHVLFDEGLLRIEPEEQVVVLDDRLRDTPYWELNGRRLRPPVHGDGPSPALLAARWHTSQKK